MSSVGTGTSGHTLIGTGSGSSPSFKAIGTNSGLTNHGVLIGQGNSPFVTTATGSNGQILQSKGASADPAYTTATYPSATTVNQILYSSSANVIGGITATNNGTLVTSATGVPSIIALTDGQLVIGSSAGAPIAATLTARINMGVTNAANSISLDSKPPVGSVNNIGISLSAGTFTVRGATASLGSTNPGYITFPSKTAGNVVSATVTADQTFIDDSGSSTIVGNTFGFGAGETATGTDVPFFLYAVLNDDNASVSFMISRQAGRTSSPAAADIGKTGSAVADNEWSFFALGNPTVADYESNPCVMIGSFRMRLTTSGGDWTVQAFTVTDGIGNFQQGITFNWPVAVNGAAANTYYTANGGTAPILNTSSYFYNIALDGKISCFYVGATPSTVGVGAVSANLTIPMKPTVNSGMVLGHGAFQNTAGWSTITCFGVSSAQTVTMVFVNITVSGTWQNATFDANFLAADLSISYYPRQS